MWRQLLKLRAFESDHNKEKKETLVHHEGDKCWNQLCFSLLPISPWNLLILLRLLKVKYTAFSSPWRETLNSHITHPNFCVSFDTVGQNQTSKNTEFRETEYTVTGGWDPSHKVTCSIYHDKVHLGQALPSIKIWEWNPNLSLGLRKARGELGESRSMKSRVRTRGLHNKATANG